MTVAASSPFRCGCGGYGHLEAHVGGINIPQRFGMDSAAQLRNADWRMVLGDLAVGCANLAVGDMGLPIAFGGGVAYKQLSPDGANRLSLLKSLVDERKFTVEPPLLLLAQHGEDSGLVGAAYAAGQLVA